MTRKMRISIIAAALAVVFVGAVAQPASAATSTVFWQGKTVQREAKTYTGSSISGGSTSLRISLAEFKMYQYTYSGYGGGYTVYGSHTATAPGWTGFTHQAVSATAKSTCYWYVPGQSIDGSLDLGCKVRRF